MTANEPLENESAASGAEYGRRDELGLAFVISPFVLVVFYAVGFLIPAGALGLFGDVTWSDAYWGFAVVSFALAFAAARWLFGQGIDATRSAGNGVVAMVVAAFVFLGLATAAARANPFVEAAVLLVAAAVGLWIAFRGHARDIGRAVRSGGR